MCLCYVGGIDQVDMACSELLLAASSDKTEIQLVLYLEESKKKAEAEQSRQKKLVPWGTDGRLPLSDLDLDLGSGHTAYRSCITHRPLPTYQISLKWEENFFSKVTIEVLVKFRVT